MAADKVYYDYLDELADTHQDRLVEALQRLEDRIADLANGAPVTNGALFDLEWAINARTTLREIIEDEFLVEVQSILTEYQEVAILSIAMLNKYGDFVNVDPAVINQLQRLTFQGFEAVAVEYLDTLATEIYQNTLTGRNVNDMVRTLRHQINGVYIARDEEEVQRLVQIANTATGARQAAAIEKLQTLYASDKVGNNMRKYSKQMIQDSLMQFDASITAAVAREAGITRFKYDGDVVRDSRPFCRKHVGKIYSIDEIQGIWSGDWKGKAAGDPFIVRGGYNCRHHFRPVLD